jgi:hypothetical protein
MTLAGALRASLEARADPDARDQAAAALALKYAELIDRWESTPPGEVLTVVGPKLLATLHQLHLTPASRGKIGESTREQPQQQQANPLDELKKRRAERHAREHGAAVHDPAAGDRPAG